MAPLFLDALVASAAMDRLLHDAYVIVMDGDSYRNPPPTKKRKGWKMLVRTSATRAQRRGESRVLVTAVLPTSGRPLPLFPPPFPGPHRKNHAASRGGPVWRPRPAILHGADTVFVHNAEHAIGTCSTSGLAWPNQGWTLQAGP